MERDQDHSKDADPVDAAVSRAARDVDADEAALAQHALAQPLEPVRGHGLQDFEQPLIPKARIHLPCLKGRIERAWRSSRSSLSRGRAGLHRSLDRDDVGIGQSFTMRRQAPDTSLRIRDRAELLEIGSRPGKAICELRCRTGIVQHGPDIIRDAEPLSDQFHEFIDGCRPSSLLQRLKDRDHQCVVFRNVVARRHAHRPAAARSWLSANRRSRIASSERSDGQP